MNTIKKLSFLALAMFMLLASCRKDIIEVDIQEERPDPTVIQGYVPEVEPITSSVTGHVTDGEDQNIENAVVTMGGQTTTTNEYGHFFFKDIEMNAKGTYVEIEKEGFFKGSRRFYPVVDHSARVSIELIEKNFNTSFNSSSGATIDVVNGGSIQFPANAIVDENDNIYDGEVRVASHWLDPTALSTGDQMPGNLTAVNELNEEVVLATFGMMVVELETPSGDPLNMLETSAAIMTFPVPAEIIGQAPAEIPLWYFNEHYGIWAQDGTATLIGNEYVGLVNHFTFWNCDVPYDLINLDLTLVDANNVPLPNHTIGITLNGVTTKRAQTDAQGYISGKVPANESLILTVFSRCNTVILSQTIGPFPDDAFLGDVVITNVGGVVTAVVSANLLNCDMNPVTKGLLFAQFGNTTLYFYTDGNPIVFNLSVCPSTPSIEFTFLDLDNPGNINETTVNVDPIINLGDITVCDVTSVPENTILVEVDGVQHVYTVEQVDAMAGGQDSTFIYGKNIGQPHYCYLAFGGNSVGVHTTTFTSIRNNFLGWNVDIKWGEELIYVLSEYGANPGDKIKGSCVGEMTNFQNQPSVSVNVKIDFNVTRE